MAKTKLKKIHFSFSLEHLRYFWHFHFRYFFAKYFVYIFFYIFFLHFFFRHFAPKQLIELDILAGINFPK